MNETQADDENDLQQMMADFDPHTSSEEQARTLAAAFEEACRQGELTTVSMMLDFIVTHQDHVVRKGQSIEHRGGLGGVWKQRSSVETFGSPRPTRGAVWRHG